VELPSGHEWDLVTDTSQDGQYLREWIPQGSTLSNTDWIISEQKLKTGNTSSKKFIKLMFSSARKACSDVRYHGPTEIITKAHSTYVGVIMCAQQIGREYGSLTYQRVIASGTDVFVITSELRVPPSSVAGVIEFPNDQTDSTKRFFERQNASGELVQNSISICLQGETDC